MRRPSGRPEPSLQALSLFPLLQRIIYDQAHEVPSTGMSACDLKEKLYCLKEIQQGKYGIIRFSWSGDGQNIYEFCY